MVGADRISFGILIDLYLFLIWAPSKKFSILEERRNFSLAWHSRFRIRRRNFGLYSIGACHCLIKSVREIFFWFFSIPVSLSCLEKHQYIRNQNITIGFCCNLRTVKCSFYSFLWLKKWRAIWKINVHCCLCFLPTNPLPSFFITCS